MLVLLFTGSAAAQTLYKCKDAGGTSVYQQTPCAADHEAVEERGYKRAPDSPNSGWLAQESAATTEQPAADLPGDRANDPASVRQERFVAY